MGKTVKAMKYEIETKLHEHLLARALRNEMAKRWEESLMMAHTTVVDRSSFNVYWEEEIDELADFQLQLMSQHQRRWESKNLYGTW